MFDECSFDDLLDYRTKILSQAIVDRMMAITDHFAKDPRKMVQDLQREFRKINDMQEPVATPEQVKANLETIRGILGGR